MLPPQCQRAGRRNRLREPRGNGSPSMAEDHARVNHSLRSIQRHCRACRAARVHSLRTMRPVQSAGHPIGFGVQGRYAQAEPFYKRALAIREAALGPEHPETLYSLQSLAAMYKAQGRFANAELLYKSAITILEKSVGPENEQVAGALNNLATVLPGARSNRRRRAALQARPRNQRGGLGPRPPRCRFLAQQPSPSVPRARAHC